MKPLPQTLLALLLGCTAGTPPDKIVCPAETHVVSAFGHELSVPIGFSLTDISESPAVALLRMGSDHEEIVLQFRQPPIPPDASPQTLGVPMLCSDIEGECYGALFAEAERASDVYTGLTVRYQRSDPSSRRRMLEALNALYGLCSERNFCWLEAEFWSDPVSGSRPPLRCGY